MTPHDFKPADHYDILGIPRDANERAIKEAYRRLVRTLHPDVNADPAAHDRFRAVSEAYRILSDPSERKRYDMRRLLYLSPLFGRLRRVVDDPARVAAMAARAKKVLERLASPPREPRPKRGRDLAIEIGVSFADAFTGATRRVTFARDTDCDACAGTGFSVRVPCEACHGAGYFAHEAFPIARKRCPRCAARGWIGREPCVVCDATGRESVEAKLAVKVPAGVSTGTRLRLSGEGERGHAGGANGDLVARVAVDSDPRFRREGRDLVTAISIDVAVAYAGGPAKVNRPSGTARLAIPPLTWPGRRLRVPGAGFADPARAVRGDLVVIVAIPEPEDGDAERRACRDAYVDAMRGPERKVPRALAERIEKLASAKA